MPSLIKRVKLMFKSGSKDSIQQKHTAAAPSPSPVARSAPAARPAPTVSVTQKPVAPSHPKNEHGKHTLAALLQSDAQLAASGLAHSPYAKPASRERFQAAKAGLEAKGFKVH
ncbi:hypothetical protein BGZ73_001840, partial [Actinomortierella ambigua]